MDKKITNVAVIGKGLGPNKIVISCKEVTVSINSLKLKLDFASEQLKQFDKIEIDGITFKKIGE